MRTLTEAIKECLSQGKGFEVEPGYRALDGRELCWLHYHDDQGNRSGSEPVLIDIE